MYSIFFNAKLFFLICQQNMKSGTIRSYSYPKKKTPKSRNGSRLFPCLVYIKQLLSFNIGNHNVFLQPMLQK